MTQTITLKTRVLPGKRIEIQSPELDEGETVNVRITRSVGAPAPDESPQERARRFREWADSHQDYPELAPEAFERGNFYGDRG